MLNFSESDLEAIDRLWRSVPSDHVWTGWSANGAAPEEVIIYRTRAHWRKFPLRRTGAEFGLYNERGKELAKHPTLDGLLAQIEALPGLTA
ncbi:MAG: hypothetical protein Hens3KO_11350 [Henriciella sp.]